MALTMVGAQTPQKLFGGVPAANAQIPGMVTPQITAAMPSMVDWGAIMNAANANQGDWNRAAAINNARFRANAPRNQEHYLPSTASQTSGMGTQYHPPASGSPSVMWAPRSLQGAQLGTWASQQQNRAIAENRQMPMVMQAHTGDPFSPGEVGGGPTSSRGLYGPGLTSPLGGANPLVWAKMWANRGRGGGGGGDGYSGDPFPTQSLRERTSPGPKYQYDMFGGR